MPLVGILPKAKFLVRGFEVVQETWCPHNSPSKQGGHAIFPTHA